MIRVFIRFLVPFAFPGHKLLIWHNFSYTLFRNGWRRTALLIEGYILKRFGCAVSAEAKIHPSVRMGHPIGIVIGAGSRIDRNVSIFQNVTLGRIRHDVPGCPHIMEGSTVYTGAVVLGSTKIGVHATVGALSVVTNDVPDGACFTNKRVGGLL